MFWGQRRGKSRKSTRYTLTLTKHPHMHSWFGWLEGGFARPGGFRAGLMTSLANLALTLSHTQLGTLGLARNHTLTCKNMRKLPGRGVGQAGIC